MFHISHIRITLVIFFITEAECQVSALDWGGFHINLRIMDQVTFLVENKRN